MEDAVAVKLLLTPFLLFFLFTVNAPIAQEAPAAPDKSGTSFYDQCGATEKNLGQGNASENLQNGFCLGYVAGISQGVESSETIHHVKTAQKIFCLPEGVTTIQKVRIIRKYIGDHPEQANKPAQGQVLMALREAFPCDK